MVKKWIGILLAVILCLAFLPAALAEGEGDMPEITHEETSDTYKERLMDSFDQTVLAAEKNIRNQLRNVLYREEITVTAENYKNIMRYVNDAMTKRSLSEDAALDHYTEQDYNIAVELIEKICDELDLDYSIDPSNDSQNEFTKVITIKKNGKVLGRINSDAKTDEVEEIAAEDPKKPQIGWIIGGGVLIAAAAVFGVVLIVRMERKKKEAA
jgi:hypothetical protein